tara:strand:- start:491 stop:1021 length:531 start_codon:yes stop_codon:yes gene_type:complete
VSWSQECVEGDCRNGFGTYTWFYGDKYVGEFKDGNRTGQGTYTWADGNKYVGAFKDGKIEGQGTFTFASGTIEAGIWENDEYLGTNEEATKIIKEREAKAERERMTRIADYIQQEEAAKKKYDRIYNACLLDKSSGVDLEISSIKTAVEKTCESIAEDPSWLESLRYNYWQKMFGH